MNHPPGPSKGITLSEARDLQQDTLGFVLQAAAHYGDLVRYPIGFWPVYLLNHPDHIQHVFLNNWQNYGRDTFQFNKFSMVTGKGLLTTDGDLWLERRRLVQPSFHRHKLASMAERMVQAIGRMVNRWRPTAAQNGSIDIDPEMLKLALDIVGQALFSLDLSAEAGDMSQEMLEMMEYVVYRSQNLLALPEFIPTKRNRRFTTSLHKFNQWVHGLIQQRRSTHSGHDDLLDLLVQSRYKDGTPLSDDEIRDECFTLLIAGYETVASGMTWILYLLAQRPELRAQLRQEVQKVTAGTAPTFDHLAQFDLLTRTVNESFRLYPPSWLITRQALQADTIGGYDIPAGALLVVCPYAIHRHEAFWPEPEQFDPNRFTAAAEQTRHKFAYIPFGGGPHLCIGRPFALMEAQLTLATILLNYDFTLAVTPPIGHKPQVTIRPEGGVPLQLRNLG